LDYGGSTYYIWSVQFSYATFMFFITCIVDNQIIIFNFTKCTTFFTVILYYNILLITATCFDPLWDHHHRIISK
jgi:hypothetical protein